MLACRAPRPSLRPFVQLLWASAEDAERAPRATRERVLPTGSAHLAIRLDTPLRVFDRAGDAAGRTLGHAVLGGPRATFYVRDVAMPSRSVGAQLLPGALRLLTDVPADELAGRHTRLDELWGAAAHELRERLLALADPARQLDLLESFLAARLPRVRGLHPAVAHALARFQGSSDVGAVAEDAGLSERRLLDLFRTAVGLPPKLYCRVLRFQQAVALAAHAPDQPLVRVALAAGFHDQPHLNRDFRALAGISPGHYRALAPRRPHHVPIAAI